MEDKKIEKIEIPIPIEEPIEEVFDFQNLDDEEVFSDEGVDTQKSGDIFDGMDYVDMVSEFGMKKTLEYINASIDLYKAIGWETDKLETDKTAISEPAFKKRMKAMKKKKKERKVKAKEEKENLYKRIQNRQKQAYNKGKELQDKLSGFSTNRRNDIQMTVELINAIPGPVELENFVIDYFIGKVEKKGKSIDTSKVMKKFEKKIEDRALPILTKVKPYYDSIMTIYNLLSDLSLNNVVKVVKLLVIAQFYPFLSLYEQYKNTLTDLENLVLEMTVIVDAVNNKASEFGSPMKIELPSIPPLPNIPDLPVSLNTDMKHLYESLNEEEKK